MSTDTVTYAPHKGHHRPCDDCVRELYAAHGWADRPRAASTRRKGPDGTTLLCGVHAHARRKGDT